MQYACAETTIPRGDSGVKRFCRSSAIILRLPGQHELMWIHQTYNCVVPPTRWGPGIATLQRERERFVALGPRQSHLAAASGRFIGRTGRACATLWWARRASLPTAGWSGASAKRSRSARPRGAGWRPHRTMSNLVPEVVQDADFAANGNGSVSIAAPSSGQPTTPSALRAAVEADRREFLAGSTDAERAAVRPGAGRSRRLRGGPGAAQPSRWTPAASSLPLQPRALRPRFEPPPPGRLFAALRRAFDFAGIPVPLHRNACSTSPKYAPYRRDACSHWLTERTRTVMSAC